MQIFRSQQIGCFLAGITLCMVLAAAPVAGQKVVDKTVATVSDGVRTELITYSDLLWQLALQPSADVTKPTSEELKQALEVLIDQRLFALEAERLPRTPPTKQEIGAAIRELVSHFATAAEFERRLRAVGFKSVDDENFVAIVRQRVAIEKYLDFRFRSFIVITAEDEAKYYRDVFVPTFHRRNPGVMVPTLNSKRLEINRELTEQRIADQMETFLDEAKRRAEIVILNQV
jgi:hypothetical protein